MNRVKAIFECNYETPLALLEVLQVEASHPALTGGINSTDSIKINLHYLEVIFIKQSIQFSAVFPIRAFIRHNMLTKMFSYPESKCEGDNCLFRVTVLYHYPQSSSWPYLQLQLRI